MLTAAGTGLTKLKSGGENSDFIERRMHALNRFMQRVAKHRVLHGDGVLRSFLESTDKVPKVESSGGMFSSVAAKLGTFVETDEVRARTLRHSPAQWFDEKVREVDQLESALKKLHTAVEGLVHRRKDLSTSISAFVESLSVLANAEEVVTLSKSVHSLADVEAKIAKLQHQQAASDFFDFCEIISDYFSLISAIRRQQAYKAWQSAEATLVKKKDAEAKALAAATTKPEKKEQAQKEVLEAEAQVQATKKNFNEITAKLREELGQFERAKVKEFKQTVIHYVETMVAMEQQIVKAWETFLPEANSITL